MPDDLDQLLETAARRPRQRADVDAVVSGAHRRSTLRRATAVTGALSVVAALAVAAPSLLPQDRGIGPIAERPPSAAPSTGADDSADGGAPMPSASASVDPSASPSAPAPVPCESQPERLLAPPDVEVGLWFVCDDAFEQVEGYPFWRTSRFEAAELAMPEALQDVVQAWFDGPRSGELAAGLSGGVSPEVATLGEVSVDGSSVTVDVLAGPEVGVLDTTTGGAVFTTGVVGAVLQFDAYDEVVFTLDGSCDRFASRLMSQAVVEGCQSFDAAHVPWADARREPDDPGDGASCPDELNLAPAPGGGPYVWLPCRPAPGRLSEDDLYAFARRSLGEQDLQEAPATTAVEVALGRLQAPGPTDSVPGLFPPEIDQPISRVTFDGGTVTVELVAEVGDVNNMGTTSYSRQITLAVVGTVLQFEEFDGVQLTIEGGGCVGEVMCRELVYDRDDVPWNTQW